MSDVIKRLGPGAVAASYIQLLDAAYDTVEDGDELMARFINTLQDSGKGVCKPSSHGYQAVMKILEARQKHTDTGAPRMGEDARINLRSYQLDTVVVDAFIHVNGAITEREELQERQRGSLNLRKVISYLEDGETPPPLPRKEVPEVCHIVASGIG
ncbi:hypothetical protein AAFF_G00054330 [Aldrovandia affinis]|uniref:Uncharacterized protein n=1 Tax=Aldrovandia affinis TaxID=143900 RepID=A0AAD7R2H5_9TELE|nr:hypothetical protein AAFF_G00054330 [Aldrovandia affinis]